MFFRAAPKIYVSQTSAQMKIFFLDIETAFKSKKQGGILEKPSERYRRIGKFTQYTQVDVFCQNDSEDSCASTHYLGKQKNQLVNLQEQLARY